MDRYSGLDAHALGCTVAIIGPSGKRWSSQVVETHPIALLQVIRAIPKDRHLCLEEGTLSGWLYEVLSPHVQEIVLILVSQTGPKSDKIDAFCWDRSSESRTKLLKMSLSSFWCPVQARYEEYSLQVESPSMRRPNLSVECGNNP